MYAFALRFPKMVEIANARLMILHSTLQLIMLSALTVWFVNSKFWENEEALGPHIHANLWMSGDTDTPAYAERLQSLNASLCSQVGSYSYWWDVDGTWKYQNLSCRFPCKPGQSDGCASLHEAYSVGNVDEAFLATHRQSVRLGPDGRAQTVDNELLLTAEAMSVSVSYFYDLPERAWAGTHYTPSRIHERTQTSSSRVATQVRDATGTVVESVPAGQEIKLSVPYLLELSGTSLDGMNADAGRNMAPGAANEPPLTRLSGMELEIHVECYRGGGYTGGKAVECFLSVVKTGRGWAYERRYESGRVDVLHGLKVVVTGGGFHRYFHLTTLMSRLTTTVVLLTAPNQFVCLICITLLGQLSVIYRQSIIDTFSLKDYMAGLSARLMVYNANFVELVDRTFSNGECGISRRRMHERLRAALKTHDELDVGEVTHLVNFCYKAIVSRKPRYGWQHLTRHIREVSTEIGLARKKDEAREPAHLDTDHFSAACTSNEHIDFYSVAALFDRDRPRRFLERLFTPSSFTEFSSPDTQFDGRVGHYDSMSSGGSGCGSGMPAAISGCGSGVPATGSGCGSGMPAVDRKPSLNSVGSHCSLSPARSSCGVGEQSSLQQASDNEATTMEAHLDAHSEVSDDHARGNHHGHVDPEVVVHDAVTLETLEHQKLTTRYLPKRVSELIKDHQFVKEHLMEQLGFQDRVLRGLEQRHRELEQSTEQHHRSSEKRQQLQEQLQEKLQEQQRGLAEQQREQHERCRSASEEQKELLKGLEALQRALEERVAECEAACEAACGAARGEVVRQTTSRSSHRSGHSRKRSKERVPYLVLDRPDGAAAADADAVTVPKEEITRPPRPPPLVLSPVARASPRTSLNAPRRSVSPSQGAPPLAGAPALTLTVDPNWQELFNRTLIPKMGPRTMRPSLPSPRTPEARKSKILSW